jgi:hypothetical protein
VATPESGIVQLANAIVRLIVTYMIAAQQTKPALNGTMKLENVLQRNIQLIIPTVMVVLQATLGIVNAPNMVFKLVMSVAHLAVFPMGYRMEAGALIIHRRVV